MYVLTPEVHGGTGISAAAKGAPSALHPLPLRLGVSQTVSHGVYGLF